VLKRGKATPTSNGYLSILACSLLVTDNWVSYFLSFGGIGSQDRYNALVRLIIALTDVRTLLFGEEERVKSG
jgi:hypothetical protein